MTKKQEVKYLENEKSFWAKIISIFHRFYRAFTSQKLSQTWECAFKKTHDWKQTVVIQTLVIPEFLVWATYVYTVRRLKPMTLVFRVQSEHWVNFLMPYYCGVFIVTSEWLSNWYHDEVNNLTSSNFSTVY